VKIDWASFGEVFVVSFGVAMGVVILFAIAVILLSPPATEPTPVPTRDGLRLAGTEATTSQATAPERHPP